MRFLILTQYFPPEVGAPQIRLAALVRALRRRGHQIEVVTAMPNHLTGKTYDGYQRKLYLTDDFEGSIVRRTWVFAATGAGLARLVNYISFAITSFLGLVRSQSPDYIFVESPPLFLGVSGSIFSTLRRVPMIFNVADLWPDSVRELGVLRNRLVLFLAERLECWIYSRSRFVNAVTTGMQADLITKKALPPSKLLFLPNGADTSLFSPREPDAELLRELQLEGRSVFIYAGTHGLAQDLEVVVEAAALMKDTNAVFLLIGDGPTKQELMKDVARRGLKNVLFAEIQPLEEMPRFFSLAVASLVPLKRRELFKGARPSKIFPSLAAGVPVIFCGEGEAADLLLKNEAGVVVEPENAPALANAVRRLTLDRDLRLRLSVNGRKLVQDHFGWDAIVEGWLKQLMDRSQTSMDRHTP